MRSVKYVYQLHAKGRLHPDTGITGHESMVSNIFAFEKDARAYKASFTKGCTNQHKNNRMIWLDPLVIKVAIVRLEFIVSCECSCHCGGFDGSGVCKQPCDNCQCPD